MPVTECTYQLLPTDTVIHDTGNQAEISSVPFLVGEVGPYLDSGLAFRQIDTRPEAHDLNGALLIQTRFADFNASSYSFSLEIDDKVTGVWVFYDDRCQTPPLWITGSASYDAASGPIDDPYARVVLSGAGPRQGVGEQAVFRGWRLNQPAQPLPAGQTANLDFYANQGCVGSESTAYAQYFIVVVTTPQLDHPCFTSSTLTNEFVVDAPEPWDSTEAAQGALDVCNSSVESYQTCPDTTQDVVCQVSAEHTQAVTQQLGTEMTERSFRISSEAQFTPNPPASPQLTITANGSTGTANDLSGALYFDYDPMTGDAVIQEISLALDHMAAGGYQISDLRIISLDRVESICKDGATKTAALCKDYLLQKGKAGFLIAADVDSQRMIFASQSSGDGSFSVDLNNRTFAYSGSQRSNSLVVNGKTIPVDIALDLRGSFVNFNPVTSVAETDQTVECDHQVGSADGGFQWVDRGNERPVNLDAWGTFDLENSQGLEYEWFQDYGTPIQRHLGSGPFVTVPEHAWSYGVHPLTLVVSEEWTSPNVPAGFGPFYRTASFHHFNMDVTDTTPPTIVAAPPDRTVYVGSKDLGTVVDIGNLKAEDVCSPEVSITNDAPAGTYFGKGTHEVRWVADDNRGNAVEFVQYIHVETRGLPGKLLPPKGLVLPR